MQRPQPRTHFSSSPSRPEDSWIEISGSDEEEEEQEEIITSGLRIRRPQHLQQRHHTYPSSQQHQQQHQRAYPNHNHNHHLAETILIDSIASLSSSTSSLSRGEESSEESEAEEYEGEGEDVASFLASQPLSDSECSADDVASEDDTEEDDEEEGGPLRPVFAEKARLEMEHDAALRASLSTLLSCAAAARGAGAHVQRDRVEGLRVVQSVSPPATTTSASVSQSVSSEEGRRTRKGGRSRRPKKEVKNEVLRTTLVTLAFSAGAIVLLSAVSFSAGYWVRRLEGGGGAGSGSGRVVDGVRRARGVRVV
ncbi:hypothetical protein BZA05DRAFT_107226 [Tricharina praecox]|uniref:uncharacterized protein n=1 Tax=Tricharina praecox TaxID=43433 RepID=UPI00221FFF75|nr:uncharacterized protein BZA05DRAFT_107226 [Tricharina praecox]KAI5857819.1 hypothetical protein BZA05DRAFT_107226 [Tricharina praecox]